jgi:hypothetical protein
MSVLLTLHVTSFLIIGEVLEKATRALTDEDKALLDKDFVGKNGQRRKLEVRVFPCSSCLLRIEHTACSLSWVVKS